MEKALFCAVLLLGVAYYTYKLYARGEYKKALFEGVVAGGGGIIVLYWLL